MDVRDAQRELRWTYLGGFPGGIVSGVLWLLAAAVASTGGRGRAMAVLVIGGTFIFPATMLLLKAMRLPATMRKENPLGGLATQLAFTIPLSYPLIYAAVLHRTEWFFPAFMVVVGAHYLPFVFLYGMRSYAVLAMVLVAGGVACGTIGRHSFAIGAWFTGFVLLLWAAFAWAWVAREKRKAGVAAAASLGAPAEATP
jgi:hypothetical protein